MKGLSQSVATLGLALAIFFAITVSMHFWLATAAPSEAPSHPIPVSSYQVSQVHP